VTATQLVVFAAMVLCGLLLSALYSGAETGLYTLNRVRLAVRAAAGQRSARWLRDLLRRPQRMLAIILVGNNIANYLASYGVAAILDGLGLTAWQAIGINAAVLIALLFVFGEILPKDLFRTHTDRWSYGCAEFLRWSSRLLTITGLVPLVLGIGHLAARLLGADLGRTGGARQRISMLIREGLGAGVLSESQTTLADRALLLRNVTVEDEMIPWTRAVTLSVDADRRGRDFACRRSTFTRLPVVDRSGRVVGILSLLDAALEPERSTASLMREPMQLDASMPARQALHDLRESGNSMAVVVRGGAPRPVGIVTLKDLVEPLTGELGAW
jgi:CBS domain containing-hemolysin-like protein